MAYQQAFPAHHELVFIDHVRKSGYLVDIAKEEGYILVGCTRFMQFTWPETVRFQDRDWKFAGQEAISMEEASCFHGKARYDLVTPERR